jgi:hypothetical protein
MLVHMLIAHISVGNDLKADQVCKDATGTYGPASLDVSQSGLDALGFDTGNLQVIEWSIEGFVVSQAEVEAAV